MRKILILFIALAAFSCDSNQGYTVKIQMDNLGGEKIILRKNVLGEIITVDSVVLDSTGFGEMSGKVEAPEMMALLQAGKKRSRQIFMANNNYTVSGSFQDIKIEADGGPQVPYNEYVDEMKQFQSKQDELIATFNMSETEGASEDSLNKIRDMFYAIQDEKAVFDSVYMVENNTIVSIYILRSMFYQLSIEELEEALSAYDKSLYNTVYYEFLSNHLEKMKAVQIGNKYVDFTLPDTIGQFIKLSDLAGQGVLLIDFWAAWCGPCRRANPGVVELYNEFHEKGFDILGVSLDRKEEDWLKAIKDDNLTWTQVSDLKFWDSEAAKLYAVSAIPHTVLLDAEGTIIARNLEKDELKEKLTELLGE